MTFDPRANPDQSSNALSPFAVYPESAITHQGRSLRARNAERQHMIGARPLRETLATWLATADFSAPPKSHSMVEALRPALARDRVVISASHDDYSVNTGGIQNAVGDEQRSFGQLGWAYLHVSPAAPLPLLADLQRKETFQVKVRLDGDLLGTIFVDQLIAELARSHRPGRRVLLVIHHLLGHLPEALAAMGSVTQADTVVWLHDHFTLCPNYTLLRNGREFCGAPDANSTPCAGCVFQVDREDHLARMAAFFTSVRPTVVAPSRVTLNFWCERNRYAYADAVVLPYARLLIRNVGSTQAATTGPAPPALRIAFVGTRAFHKGWAEFSDLALGLADDRRYDFYYFGSASHPSVAPLPECIRQVSVQVTAAHRAAMVEALEHHRIDVVVIWSIWPETFCFVAYEALAAGAFVVTNVQSGNVGPAIQDYAPGQGCVLQDESALNLLFINGDIMLQVANSTRQRGSLALNRYTADDRLLSTPEGHASGVRRRSQGLQPHACVATALALRHVEGHAAG